jgi:hypothetical protein
MVPVATLGSAINFLSLIIELVEFDHVLRVALPGTPL